MTPAPKPRRISREEAIEHLEYLLIGYSLYPYVCFALRAGIRALKREQKAADAKKKKETKR